MAKGIKTGGKDFQAGQSGNKKGRPSVPKEIRDLRKLGSEELKVLISALLYANEDDVVKIKDDPAQPLIRRIICQILENAFVNGSMPAFDQLLNRVIGKVKEEVDVTITKPQILVRKDGTEVIFTNRALYGGNDEED